MKYGPKLEAKLNTWAVNTLPNIVKDLIKSQAITAVDEYISSPEFTQTINESIKFDTDELKDTIKATEAKITKLETGKPELLECINELEQYMRCTNLRIFGIPESTIGDPEDTDSLVMNFFANELGIEVSTQDISHSHRAGQRSSKPRPIIVRLTKHNTKVEILRK